MKIELYFEIKLSDQNRMKNFKIIKQCTLLVISINNKSDIIQSISIDESDDI